MIETISAKDIAEVKVGSSSDGYHCKECGLAVIVSKDGKILRPCGHTGTIIAGMNATAKGISKMEQGHGIQ